MTKRQGLHSLEKNKNKTALALIVTAVAAVIAAIFRAFQLLAVINYEEMGFFDTDASFAVSNGIYVLFLLAALFLIVTIFIDLKKGSLSKPAEAFTPKQTLIIGIAFLIGASFKLYDTFFNFKGISAGFLGEIIILIVYALIGFIILSKEKLKPTSGYMMLIIAVSYTIKASELFMGDTVIIRVSSEIILLMSYVATVLFFLALGRYISNSETKYTVSKLIFFASVSVMLSACASLSGYLALMFDPAYMKSNMSNHPISQIGTIAIAFAVMWAIYNQKTIQQQESGEREEL